MSITPETGSSACRACGASVPADYTMCWLCHAPSAHASHAASALATPPQDAGGHWTFSLSTLMLVVSLVAVTLGIAGLEPILGGNGGAIVLAMLFAVVAAPALLRTSLVSLRRRRQGRAMTFPEKLLVLLGSLGVMAATGVAACAAFCATCFAGTFGGGAVGGAQGYDIIAWFFFLGLPLGIIIALVVGFFMLRWLWPRKESAREKHT